MIRFLLRQMFGQLLKQTWPPPEGNRFCSCVWVRLLNICLETSVAFRRVVHMCKIQDDSSGLI